jgi:nitrogen fixation/metabolism regulation signal transduction histidine kinase
VQAAYSEYQQRALARDGLRRMYIGTLTLALVLAVFGAVLLAILLGTSSASRCCCWPTACARWPPAT